MAGSAPPAKSQRSSIEEGDNRPRRHRSAQSIRTVGRLPVTQFVPVSPSRIVMEIVGHGAIEMTMNIYGHVNVDTQRKALEHLDRSCHDWSLLSISAVKTASRSFTRL